MVDKHLLIAMPSFCLEELIAYLNISDSQTHFQQLHDGLYLQESVFRQHVIVVDLIFNDMQGFIDSYISENVKKTHGQRGHLETECLQTSTV
jgi:hypothetical protein